MLFVHSAFQYPTLDDNGVFFGPDTYRFLQWIDRTTLGTPQKINRALDLGCGTGAGGLFLARKLAVAELYLTDVNQHSLHFSLINAHFNIPSLRLVSTPSPSTSASSSSTSTPITTLEYNSQDSNNKPNKIHLLKSDLFKSLDTVLPNNNYNNSNEGEGNHLLFDIIVANPPYIAASNNKEDGSTYCDGGELGITLPTQIVIDSIQRLSRGGTLLLYTGTPIVNGKDLFYQSIQEELSKWDLTVRYEELDVDVFGEELESNQSYIDQGVERIAVVGLAITKQGTKSM